LIQLKSTPPQHQTAKIKHQTVSKSQVYLIFTTVIKIVLLHFFGFFVFFASAQKPIHFANAYTIGENNPLIDYNHAAFATLVSGEKLYISYNGKAAIVGNNYVDSVKGWNSLNLVSLYPITFAHKDEIWLMAINGMAIIKNKGVTKQVKGNWGNCWFLPSQTGKGVIIADYVNFRISFFDGEVEHLKYQFPDTYKTSLSLLKKDFIGNYFIPDTKNNIWFFTTQKNKLYLLKYNEKLNNFDTSDIYQLPIGFEIINPVMITDNKNFTIQNIRRDRTLTCENGYIHETKFTYNATQSGSDNQVRYVNHLTLHFILAQDLESNFSQLYPPISIHELKPNPILIVDKKVNLYSAYDSVTNSWLLGSENKPLLAFPNIQKFPTLYKGKHSNATFSLSQDDDGNIWAGSYNGAVTIIDKSKEKMKQLHFIKYPVMNGALHIKNRAYLIGEGIGSLNQINSNTTQKVTGDIATGFYLYQSPINKKIHYGKPAYMGLWITDADSLDRNKPNWYKIDSTKGLSLHNVLTITEDKLGRIWCGHPGSGIGVYDPKTDKAKTWLTDKGATKFGAMSSLTDKWGTVWLGSRGKGLWYYNDYPKSPEPNNCLQLRHPLLDDPTKTITSMCLNYGQHNYLVLGCYDKICLLDLDSFYQKKKTIVRYMHPEEAAFSSFTEQNTMFTSHSDSSIWFSTSDMVYNWDIKNWLLSPTNYVQPKLLLSVNKDSTYELNEKTTLSLQPNRNSLSLEVKLLSPDLLSRYLQVAMIKKGDSLDFAGTPTLLNKYEFANLNSGDYVLLVRIFQADGSISLHQFPITIKKFLYEQWWFWLLAMVLFTTPMLLWLNTKRKQAIQQRQLSQMNIVTLSNQFRPHFILNTLNTVGADLQDKPDAEKVISRLGESINLIFNHAQQKRSFHFLQQEWTLVKNVIDIHRLMYIPELALNLPDDTVIESLKDLQIPLGMLQIHVENALLHGLRNKRNGPYQLTIEIQATTEQVCFEIVDNGVGRVQASTMSNFKKHGTGTKNQQEIINILNQRNQEKITIHYLDADNRQQDCGTKVIICIPKNYQYEP
jgi:hypothetical protein